LLRRFDRSAARPGTVVRKPQHTFGRHANSSVLRRRLACMLDMRFDSPATPMSALEPTRRSGILLFGWLRHGPAFEIGLARGRDRTRRRLWLGISRGERRQKSR